MWIQHKKRKKDLKNYKGMIENKDKNMKSLENKANFINIFYYVI